MADRNLFFFVSIMVLFGMIASYSLPVYFVYIKSLSHYHFFIREFFVGILGILIIWGMSKLDPDQWLHKIGFFLFGFFLLVMFAMPFLPESIVPTINGARRWVKLPLISLSPVEFFKVGFIYFLSWSFTRKFYLPEEKFHILKEAKILLPYIIVFGVVVLLVAVMQNDFGQVVVLGATLLLMSFFAGASFKIFASMISISFVGAFLLIIT
ncbi:MAG: FtsW/RodA/SpoVE family cell cycle protein, partial [Campylobacterales bacterium]|nr:FtsW/RodA/SpoVE family cell cycle protein [Campylobacterales bacterium]